LASHLILVRHASVQRSVPPRFLGRTDVPLDEHGRRQAAGLAALASRRKPQRLLASPLRRAQETAHAIARPLGLEVQSDPDLREIDFGRWEGMTFDEIQAADPKAVSQWNAWSYDFTPPGGERLGDFLDRVRRAAGRLAADPAEVVMAVTHGGVIRSALCHLLGLPARNYLLFDVQPAALVGVRLFDGRGVLSEMLTPQEPEDV